MNRWTRLSCFLLIVAVGTVLDLASKAVVFHYYGMPGVQDTCWLLPGVLGIQTSLNEGALFGMGQGFSAWFCAFSVLAVGFILYWLFVAGNAKSWMWTVVLALMTAGVIGNLYDRLGWSGLFWNYPSELHQVGEPVHAVRDWILVMLGNYHWPNFNLADSFLVVGASWIFLMILLEKKDEPEVSDN
ncbi:MAG: signal peptidase II [Planctomycetia bacterium]|nr:signal peptidase II [Planctomycetia bacterium]